VPVGWPQEDDLTRWGLQRASPRLAASALGNVDPPEKVPFFHAVTKAALLDSCNGISPTIPP